MDRYDGGEAIAPTRSQEIAPKAPEAAAPVRKPRRPPILGGACTHRLGTYQGGRW